MKKYTILDSTGQKKIVYAPNMKKALRYVGDGKKTDIEDSVKDSKVKDEDDYFYFDADEDDRSLDDYKRIMKQCGLTITKVEGNNREAFIYYRGSSSAEQKAAKMLGISLEDSVKDSKVKDRMSLSEIDEAISNIADKYDGFYSRTYDKVFKDLKAKYPNLTYEEVKQVIVQYADNPSSASAQLRAAKKYFSDSIHDEASLATTINALVNDEKAAIDAYNVVIKNLEGSIDDTARQVLINIRDDERRHIENLYSILNGNITEKNLEDSKIVDEVQTAETYANTGWIEKLASDLLNEGQKNGYDFDAVLKKFDSLSKQILVIVKNALDKAKKEVVDYKSRY